ncbi:MAG: four helix bundle protein [Candidatus Levybacteria bacterium]|nr:four helix bundle protein [Candidatus Levybacteria bacterium]
MYQKPNIKYQSQNKSPKMEVKYRAFYLSIDIIRFLEKLSYRASLKIISDQLIRSITSVGANIVEAKASSSKKEFMNYFQIALKSANEAKYWLAMLKELLPEKKEEIDVFLKELDEISRIIGTSVLTMKGKTKL